MLRVSHGGTRQLLNLLNTHMFCIGFDTNLMLICIIKSNYFTLNSYVETTSLQYGSTKQAILSVVCIYIQ